MARIAFAHCVNVSLDKDKNDTNALEHYIFTQAEKHHAANNASQTWVIHWITASPTEVTYWFPDSSTVNTLYVYHDSLFHKCIVATKDGQHEVENPLPSFLSTTKKTILIVRDPSKQLIALELMNLITMSIAELKDEVANRMKIAPEHFMLVHDETDTPIETDMDVSALTKDTVLRLVMNEQKQVVP